MTKFIIKSALKPCLTCTLILWGALVATLALATDPAFAISPPRLSASIEAPGLVKVDISLGDSNTSAAVLRIERSQDGGPYELVEMVSKPAVQQSLMDLLSVPGNYRYRVRLIKNRKRSAWAKTPVLQYDEGSDVDDGSDDADTPDLTPPGANPVNDGNGSLAAGLNECPIGVAQSMISQLNLQREQAGVGGLFADGNLTSSARAHSISMAQNQLMVHDGWFEEIIAGGFSGTHFAQNIASVIVNPVDVVNALMQSPGHRLNILDSRNDRVGIGCIIGADGKYYWTQNFGG